MTHLEEVIYVSIFGTNYSKRFVEEAIEEAKGGKLDYHQEQALIRNANDGYLSRECAEALEEAKKR